MKRIGLAHVLGILAGFALAFTLIVPASGCAWWQKSGGQAILDCGSQAMQAFENNMAEIIASVLKDQNWEVELTGLETQLGANGVAMVTCIVEHLLHPAANARKLIALSADQRAHGQAYLAKKRAMVKP